ncbi:bifunctional glycosyltransferase/CDP-glycerol:glycerophosphate glycerophosphotransferase [Ectopseudomonas chengduensis]
MQKLSIDVIVAVYNAENTIERCLTSIFRQTHQAVRLIVVDDGSTDRTLEIIARICEGNENRLTVIQQENAGPGAARNKGLSVATADFIGFVDADDYISEDMYGSMLSAVEDETDFVMCGRCDLFEGGESVQVLPNPKHNRTSLYDNEQLLSLTSVFIWDKIFRRSVVVEFGLVFPEHIRYGEDCVFLTKFKAHGRQCKVVRKALYYHEVYRVDSITSRCSALWLDIPVAIKDVSAYYCGLGLFFRFWEQLQYLAVGFYKRRVDSLPFHGNKIMQMRFVLAQRKLMDAYFPTWREILKNPIYNNFFAVILFVLTPNVLKRNFVIESSKVRRLKYQLLFYRYCQKVLPLRKKVLLFISYSGDAVSDNPLYMARDFAGFKGGMIFFASKNCARDRVICELNGWPFKVVDVDSLDYARVLATANYVVTNSRVPTYFNKRSGQRLINTWHGTPIKTLGASMLSGVQDIGRNQNQFLMSDFLLYPNEFSRDRMLRDFCLDRLYKGKVVLQGYPRNDAFFRNDLDVEGLYQSLRLKGKRVFLYMPTWRGISIGGINKDKYGRELVAMFSTLDEQLNEDVVLLVKLHQSVAMNDLGVEFKNIRFVPESSDIYEVLTLADALVTDYSSVMFDYLYSSKPVVLFLYDYEHYARERGFYFDVAETPFSKAYSVPELASLLNNGLPAVDYTEFSSRFCLPYPREGFSHAVNEVVFSAEQTIDLSIPALETAESYDIYFCDGCTSSAYEEKLLELADKDGALLVFRQREIDSATEKFIFANLDRLSPFVIAPGGFITTWDEQLVLCCYRKFGFFERAVKEIYRDELKRIMPGVKYRVFHNFSADPLFAEITEILGESGL